MSTVIATSVLPDSTANDTLTIGATGDSVAISGDSLNLNSLQDAGGNNTFVSDGSGTITSTGLPGAMKFISAQTASGAASVSFTSGIDSTYDVYIFKFSNINGTSDSAEFTFQVSTDGGSSYGVTITSTFYYSANTEAGSGGVAYHASYDLVQSTNYQTIGYDLGSDADECLDGELHLFVPSSTTYVKNFYSNIAAYDTGGPAGGAQESFSAGYVNNTSAVDAINFKMNAGNFDGTIALYGISKT
jgi:hypothetical protein